MGRAVVVTVCIFELAISTVLGCLGLVLLAGTNNLGMSLLSYTVPGDHTAPREVRAFYEAWIAFFVYCVFVAASMTLNYSIVYDVSSAQDQLHKKIYRRLVTWTVVTICSALVLPPIICTVGIIMVFPATMDGIFNVFLWVFYMSKLYAFMGVANYREELKVKRMAIDFWSY